MRVSSRQALHARGWKPSQVLLPENTGDQMHIRRRLESVAADRDSRVGDMYAALGLVLE
jgi:hypothetical protein